MQAPVTVLNMQAKRETGKNAQLGNILAAKVCDCPYVLVRSLPVATALSESSFSGGDLAFPAAGAELDKCF